MDDEPEDDDELSAVLLRFPVKFTCKVCGDKGDQVILTSEFDDEKMDFVGKAHFLDCRHEMVDSVVDPRLVAAWLENGDVQDGEMLVLDADEIGFEET